MKVGELLEQLRGFDKDSEIVCYSDDESLTASSKEVRFFHVENVQEREAEPDRLDDGTPWLKFEQSEASRRFAILTITSDF